jgi:GNAT superfamily N-acetyltransferase
LHSGSGHAPEPPAVGPASKTQVFIMIRIAKVEDCSRIAEIHVFSWRSTYREFIDDIFLFHDFRVEERTRAFKNAIEIKSEETYVYEENTIIKGILTIGNARDKDKDNKCFELWGIYVDPFFVRQKIGTYLVKYCIGEARKRNRNEIVLWVFEKNLGARVFYEKMGFHHDGKRKLLDRFKEYEIRYSREN